jgi:threonine dehydratase
MAVVRQHLPPTPQYAWPQLAEHVGTPVWVKHENHTPTGAFKIRGGLVLMDGLHHAGQRRPVVTATRGNHGQSLALAGAIFGIPVTVVVPEVNDADKNAAMRAHGAQVVVHGRDFQEARDHSVDLAERSGAHHVPAFHPELVRGVATYAAELFAAVADLDAVYVPIGMGSGICGLITVRDLLGLRTEIIGVVSAAAPAYARSYAAGHLVTTDTAETFADGVACRVPDEQALAIIRRGAADVIAVPDELIAEALRLLHRTTHNAAEGAGAVGLAGVLADGGHRRHRQVATVLSGGNIGTAHLAALLQPQART